jgi:hypothetical protein
MHGENCTNRITNYALGHTANEHSGEARSIMLGKGYYSSLDLFLSFDDLFLRMAGAQYRLHYRNRKFLCDDLAETLDRFSN